MQTKMVLLAGFSFLCLVASLATTASGKGAQARQDKPCCDSIGVLKTGETAVFAHGDAIFVFDKDYLTLYEVNTSADPGEKGYPAVRTRLGR
jgi:hypothetical protein